MTGCTIRRYDQLETSPETIEQELRPAVCERRQTDRLMENYSIDKGPFKCYEYDYVNGFFWNLDTPLAMLITLEHAPS